MNDTIEDLAMLRKYVLAPSDYIRGATTDKYCDGCLEDHATLGNSPRGCHKEGDMMVASNHHILPRNPSHPPSPSASTLLNEKRKGKELAVVAPTSQARPIQ